MGLDIQAKSKYKYSFSYTGIHYIRYITYLSCKGEKGFGDYISMANKDCYDWEFIMALHKYPQIIWHSDSEGSYTKKGKITDLHKMPLTGNSVELLKELKMLNNWISKNPQIDVRLDTFYALFNLVKDVVKKGNGYLKFV